MINVSERVKKALFDRGWTQKKLCGEINITETGFKRMADNNTWKLDTLEKMATALGVPIVYFVTDDEKNTTQDNYLREILQRMEESMNKLTTELSVKDRQIEKLIDLLGKLEGAILEPLSNYTGDEKTDYLKYLVTTLQKSVFPMLRSSIFLPPQVAK
jgi:transcriptional regulator with XRE-family HTH domain